MRQLSDLFSNVQKAVLFDAFTSDQGDDYLAFLRFADDGMQIVRLKMKTAACKPDDPVYGRLPVYAALAADPETALAILAMIPAGYALDLGYGGGDSANETLIVWTMIDAGKELVERALPKIEHAGVQEVARGVLARLG